MATPHKVGKHWEVTVELPRALDGQRRQTRLSARTKREVEDRAQQLVEQHRAGTYVPASGLLVREYLPQWWESYRPYVRQATAMSYLSIIRQHLQPRVGALPLQQLRSAHVHALYAELREKGLSERTISHVHALLHLALRAAVKQELLLRNPMDLVTAPRPKRTEMRTLTPEEMQRLLEASLGTEVELLIHLAVHTGLRRSEILGLRWADIDLAGGYLMVVRSRHAVARGGVTEPKSERSRRMVALSSSLLPVLRAHQAHPNAYVVSLQYDRSFRATQRVFERAGIHATFHELRHSQASILLAQGIPLHEVSRRLGHADASVTARVYAHLLPGREQQAADAFDRAITEGNGKTR